MQKTSKLVIYFLYIFFALFIFSCKNSNTNKENGEPLFKLLPSENTNVTFQNTLSEGPNTNILMYEYFYNGGGVAAGDFNNDGFEDLYFTSNMRENKLYLNKSKMVFEDITEASGAGGRPGPWKTGVSVIDINADGKLDIYLCYSGAMPIQKRTNQFFINQGNDSNGIPIFIDKASELGLDSPAFSNQAYFFDFDLDHDLDMLLLNHNPKALPVLNEAQTIDLHHKDEPLIGVRLFQNNNNHFDDISIKSGISSSSLTYGLGIGISDFNNDGWPDFYISNDYQVPDYLYINNKNGTFSDQIQTSLGHSSQFSMGNDIADINNDRLLDIFTLDMLPEDNHRQKLLIAPDNYSKFDLNVRSGFGYQYMRNMMHINNGNNTFSEIGQLAGISNTDWSWSALFADYDRDGFKDLFVTNGYTRDFTNLDFIKFMNGFVKEKGRLMREDVQQIIEKMPASNVSNYIFSNKNGLNFENCTQKWGIGNPSNSNGAAYADLDNDGDLDLIVNNINKEAFIYENQLVSNNYLKITTKGDGRNTQGIGAKITVICKGNSQLMEQNPARGYLSTVSTTLNFGLGKNESIDTLIVDWVGGKRQTMTHIKSNQTIQLNESDANDVTKENVASKTVFTETKPPFEFIHATNNTNDFSRQPLLISQLSHLGPITKSADLNNDGFDDIVVGGGKNQSIRLFYQQKNGSFNERKSLSLFNESDGTIADISIFDANNDGFKDIYLAHGGYDQFAINDPKFQDQLFFNDKKGNFIIDHGVLPKMLSPKSVVETMDINGDGFLDIFVGTKSNPGNYPQPADNYLLINNGKGAFSDQIDKIAPELKSIGMVSDAKWVDLNANKVAELIVVGEMTPVMIFENLAGKLQLNTEKYLDSNANGFWNSIEIGDFNNDSKPDIVLGNIGTNTQFRASTKEPLEMIYGDFDKNGTIDPILCTYIQGKSYPYITRDEFFMQFAGFKAKYNSYESYADATIESIFDKGELKNGKRIFANKLESVLLLSTKSSIYTIVDLPIQAQYSCINDILVFDYDQDHNLDLLLVGNNQFPKIRLGKQDSNYGTLLRGNGKGGLTYINQVGSGLQLKGTVRSVCKIGRTVLFGINEKPMKAYKLTNN